jgi:hypothetical protein
MLLDHFCSITIFLCVSAAAIATVAAVTVVLFIDNYTF